MNASCEPTVRPTPLRAKHASKAPGLANAPRVLFLATRDIAAGEELTWRYNAAPPQPKSEKPVKSVYGGRRSQGPSPRDAGVPAAESVPCICGAPTCKQWL